MAGSTPGELAVGHRDTDPAPQLSWGARAGAPISVLLKLAHVAADSWRMFGFGSRTDSGQRAPLVDWRAVAPYGLTLLMAVVAGWAISQLG